MRHLGRQLLARERADEHSQTESSARGTDLRSGEVSLLASAGSADSAAEAAEEAEAAEALRSSCT